MQPPDLHAMRLTRGVGRRSILRSVEDAEHHELVASLDFSDDDVRVPRTTHSNVPVAVPGCPYCGKYESSWRSIGDLDAPWLVPWELHSLLKLLMIINAMPIDLFRPCVTIGRSAGKHSGKASLDVKP